MLQAVKGSTVKENAEFARKGVKCDLRGSIDCCWKGGDWKCKWWNA